MDWRSENDEIVNLDDMNLEEFLLVARQKGLATPTELDRFAADWRREYENGEPGFGDETTIRDWVGGFECWRELDRILEANGLTHETPIDCSNLKVNIRRTN